MGSLFGGARKDNPMSSHLHIQPLDPARHNRAAFDCGVPELNDYLVKTANQDVNRKAAGCWVALPSADSGNILGYYTLSSDSVETAELPELPSKVQKNLPRYRRLGAALLGRLAVSKDFQRQRLGERLLFDALTRCLSSQIPFVLVLVDPKDDEVAAWYARFGFRPLNGSRMFVTAEELRAYFQSSG